MYLEECLKQNINYIHQHKECGIHGIWKRMEFHS